MLKNMKKQLLKPVNTKYYSITAVAEILDDLLNSEITRFLVLKKQIEEIRSKIYDKPGVITEYIPLVIQQFDVKINELEKERDNFHKSKKE